MWEGRLVQTDRHIVDEEMGWCQLGVLYRKAFLFYHCVNDPRVVTQSRRRAEYAKSVVARSFRGLTSLTDPHLGSFRLEVRERWWTVTGVTVVCSKVDACFNGKDERRSYFDD